jgi:hypothetical protein
MTSHQRSTRNVEVVAARARGLGWEEIASRFKISSRQARRIVAEYRECQPRLHEVDPIETIEEAFQQYDAAISDLAILSEKTTHSGVKLGAIKGRLDALRAKLDLMAAVGVLPRNLGRLQVEFDARQVAQSILQIFSTFAVPIEAQEAVIRAIESRSGGSNGAIPSVARSENGAHT